MARTVLGRGCAVPTISPDPCELRDGGDDGMAMPAMVMMIVMAMVTMVMMVTMMVVLLFYWSPI